MFKNPYAPFKLAFEHCPACALGTAPTTNMQAKTTNEMIVFFMMILLTWLLLIDMLFNAFFIFISPLCLFLWSGHRLLASAVDCVPFVIESPKVTIAPVCLDANTSTPASQNHASVVESTGFGQIEHVPAPQGPAPPTGKQQLAAIRMRFDWLVLVRVS